MEREWCKTKMERKETKREKKRNKRKGAENTFEWKGRVKRFDKEKSKAIRILF